VGRLYGPLYPKTPRVGEAECIATAYLRIKDMRFFIVVLFLWVANAQAQNVFFWSGEGANFSVNDPRNWRTETGADGSSDQADGTYTGDFVLEEIDAVPVGLVTVYQRSGRPAQSLFQSAPWFLQGQLIIPSGASLSNSGYPVQCTNIDLLGRLEWSAGGVDFPISLLGEFSGVILFSGSGNPVLTDTINHQFPTGRIQLNLQNFGSYLDVKSSLAVQSIEFLNGNGSVLVDDTVQLHFTELMSFGEVAFSGNGSLNAATGAMVNLFPPGQISFDVPILTITDSIGIEGGTVVLGDSLSLEGEVVAMYTELGNGELILRPGFQFLGQQFKGRLFTSMAEGNWDISKNQEVFLESGELDEVNCKGDLHISNSGGVGVSLNQLMQGESGRLWLKDGAEGSGKLIIPNGAWSIVDELSEDVWRKSGAWGVYKSAGSSIVNATGGQPQLCVRRNLGSLPWTQYSYWSSPFQSHDLSGIPAVYRYAYQDLAEGDAGWTWISGALKTGQGAAFSGVNGGDVSLVGIPNLEDVTSNTPLVGEGVVGQNEYWTLLGNPYAAGINAGAFLNANADHLIGAIYLWNQSSFSGQWGFSSSDYTIINGLGTNNPDASGYINEGQPVNVDDFVVAPFQGFFVQCENSFGVIGSSPAVFNTGMIEMGAGKEFYQKSNADGIPGFWVVLKNVNSQERSSLFVGAKEGATWGWDKRWDASTAVDRFGIYSDVEGRGCQILGVPEFGLMDSVQLQLKLEPGNYSLEVLGNPFFEENVYGFDFNAKKGHNFGKEPYLVNVVSPEKRTMNIYFSKIALKRKLFQNKAEYKADSLANNSKLVKKFDKFDILGRRF
jgi:hypothetical protein